MDIESFSKGASAMHGGAGGGHYGGGVSIGGHHHGGAGTHHHHANNSQQYAGMSSPYVTPRSGRRSSPGVTIAALVIMAAIIGGLAMLTLR